MRKIDELAVRWKLTFVCCEKLVSEEKKNKINNTSDKAF